VSKNRGQAPGEFADVRYSALNPKTWRWIAMSGLYVVLYSYTPCTGTVLRPAEEEAAYLFLRAALSSLELASEDSKLPPTLTEFRALYDSVVATELAENPFITAQFAGLTRLPLPTTLLPGWSRLLLTPAWLLVRPMIGHTIQVCSSKIMHPGVQRLTGFKLKRRHDVEYALYTRILQSAWKYLPDRVLLVPLAYNRLQYEKLVGFHRRYGHLESFTVPAGRGCPM
jgi:uncharacterized protein (DUF2236 family)